MADYLHLNHDIKYMNYDNKYSIWKTMEESRGSVDSLQALRISHLTPGSGTSGLHSKISIFNMTERIIYNIELATSSDQRVTNSSQVWRPRPSSESLTNEWYVGLDMCDMQQSDQSSEDKRQRPLWGSFASSVSITSLYRSTPAWSNWQNSSNKDQTGGTLLTRIRLAELF